MATQAFAFNTSGQMSSGTVSNQATLIAATQTAIDAAATANAVAGAKADVTTELAACTTALAAVTANQPSGAVVITVDYSQITTKNQLRRVFEQAARFITESASGLT